MLRLVARVLLAVVTAVAALMVATAGTALAHNELKSSDPGEGATLATAPHAVKLVFNEELDVDHTQVSVTGPNGSPASAGAARITGDTATVDLVPGPAGTYTITYSTVADDGDKSGGTIRFSVTTSGAPAGTGAAAASSSEAALPPAPTTAVQATQTNSSGGWAPWAIGAGVVVLLAVVVAVVLGRRRRAGS
jgi:methionine-rich copper-binding protein CopC